MEIYVSSEIKVVDPSDEVLNYIEDALVIKNPDYQKKVQLGIKLWNTPEYLKLYKKEASNVFILPFGTFKDLWEITKNKATWHNAIETSDMKANWQGGINLYPYQEIACKELKNAKNGILKAGCGSGKTQIGLELAHKIGLKTLWITHTHELLKQSKERYEQYFKGGAGTITEGKIDIGDVITFATVQTLAKIDPKNYAEKFGCVIVDECHHCIGTPTKMTMFYKVLSNIDARYKYGLTATTKKTELGKTMFSVLGNLEHEISKSVIGNKIIKSKLEVIEIDKEYDIEKYCNADGTLNYVKLLNTLESDEDRNNIILENIKENHAKGKKQMILVSRLENVYRLFDECKKFARVKSYYRGLKNDENYEIIIATFQKAKEGLDEPELNVLHICSPIKDEISIVQSIGRIERNYAGKETPIAYFYQDKRIAFCNGALQRIKRYYKNN